MWLAYLMILSCTISDPEEQKRQSDFDITFGMPGVDYEFWSPSPSYPANYDLDSTPVKD